jgi:WD40 repeat protein
MTAALGVIMDPATGAQTFYGGKQVSMEAKSGSDESEFHRDDILSLDVSGDRKLVITGQSGKQPSVHVWNAEDQTQVCSFQLEKGARGVAAVSISSCGRYVACVDMSNDHKVTIYNIERKKLLVTVQGGTEKIFDVAWSKRADDLRFATLAQKSVSFWHPADITKKL